MSGARREILERIRSALRDVPADERPRDVVVERSYLHTSDLPAKKLVALFAERIAEYRVTVHRIAAAELADTIRQRCRARAVARLVLPADLPDDWIPAGIEALRDDGLTDGELDSADGVLTGCAVAIAQTGTIVLDGGPGQGRRALTLVPDYHLCVVRSDQIVGLVPVALARLEAGVRSEGRPVTFISGPSATSDIELNRVEGVHGPRNLEVVIVR
ncbi:MAG: lactate utilization protein C [Actinomycetota bacterium]